MPRRGARSLVIPFIGHQILDYLAGLYLIQIGSKASGRAAAVFYGAGAVMLLIATLSGRPLGGGPVSRPVHRVVDGVFVVALAAAPFVFGLTGDAANVVRLDGLAALLAADLWFTNYARPRPRGETARAIRQQGPRVAGQMLGRRMAGRRRPPEDS